MQIEIRCWDSTDAITATPTRVPFPILETLGTRITRGYPGGGERDIQHHLQTAFNDRGDLTLRQ
jgi:hypothetical protein